jgi:hypothetical protein
MNQAHIARILLQVLAAGFDVVDGCARETGKR